VRNQARAVKKHCFSSSFCEVHNPERNVEIFIDKAVVLVFNNIVVNQSRDISGSGGGAVDTLPLRA
jgi:hypothetical protein